jgi:hypothetical protein
LLTAFNELYLVYVAPFALTLFTLIGGIARIDPTDLKEALDGHPVRGYVAFQALVAGLVALKWLAEVGPASLAGTRPPEHRRDDASCARHPVTGSRRRCPGVRLSAAPLWKQRAWGDVVTGVLLVKGTTLGLAVLATIAFVLRNGQTVPLPQIVLFALLSLTGLGLTTRFVRAISRSSSRTQPHTRTDTQPD